MSDELPVDLGALVDRACEVIDASDRRHLREVAQAVAISAWRHYLAWRTPADNRSEHEFIVLGNTLRIAVGERLSVSDLRVAIAFCFLHDTHFIPRITEWRIRELQREADAADARAVQIRGVAAQAADVQTADRNAAAESSDELAARAIELRQRSEALRTARLEQRQRHMDGGAANADFLLQRIQLPGEPPRLALDDAERRRCCEIIARHDDWKLKRAHPPSDDRLAVACLEGDALWPLHPLGVQADLERPGDDARIADVWSPAEWRRQVAESLKTLREHRGNWSEDAGFTTTDAIFRTVEGGRIYREWCEHWRCGE